MQTVEIQIYTFEELSDKAKDKARDWFKSGMEYPWYSESIDSIRGFVGYFGAELKDWSIGSGCGHDFIKTNASNEHFRGKKLSEFSLGCHDGWWLDGVIWDEFYKQFKRTGDAKYAFEQALECALSAIVRDIDYHYSDECVDDTLTLNEYQFTADGRIFNR